MTAHLFVTRAQWGSTMPPGGNPMGVVSEAYVHHYNSGIAAVTDTATGMARMRGAQNYHVYTNGWADIGYSFCVDQAGTIYEGRGWRLTGAHTEGYNSKGYGICWLGDSNVATPTPAALDAIAEVVRQGIELGHITSSPTIVAHRDRSVTSCCGDPMYALLPEIRRLVAEGAPVPPVTDAGVEDMAKAFIAPDSTLILVTGGTYHKVNTPWPQAHKGLIDLQRAGVVQEHAPGELWRSISAEALAVLEEVG